MKDPSDELIFHSQGLRRSAADLADRIGESAFAEFSSRSQRTALRKEVEMAYIGIIADDFTGASDAASFLVKGGLRTKLYNGTASLSDSSASLPLCRHSAYRSGTG